MNALTETGTAKAPVAAKTIRDDAVAALRFGWGDAYRIGCDPVRGWWARRRDDLGGDITGDSADSLWKAIREDYAFKPVPRDHGAPLAAK